MTSERTRAFTIVEIIVIITVIALLAAIATVAYGGWQRNIAEVTIQSDVAQATASLKAYNNHQSSYPPNLAGTSFIASRGGALTLYTDAPSVGTYSNLTPSENAQLFLNVCNANLNGLDNTVCTFAGNAGGAKIHVKGTVGSNTIWPSPINQGDLTLSCGAACTSATDTMIAQLIAQGGTFPIIANGANVALPAPTQTPNGPAKKFCLEGRSGNFPDVVYHTTSTVSATTIGPCPDDPSLHYFS